MVSEVAVVTANKTKDGPYLSAANLMQLDVASPSGDNRVWGNLDSSMFCSKWCSVHIPIPLIPKGHTSPGADDMVVVLVSIGATSLRSHVVIALVL